MKLFIIRHGDPDYANDTLTERGWKEAKLLRDRLMNENITKVYLSPLGRAQDTAKPFLYSSGLSAETLDWLREFPRPAYQPLKKYGIADSDFTSCPWDLDIRLFTMFATQLSDRDHWFEHEIYTEKGTTECALNVFRETDKLLLKNGLERDGFSYKLADGFDKTTVDNTNIAIFCHMGLGSLLAAYLNNIAPPLYWQMFRVMPTSVTTVLFNQTHTGNYISKTFTVGDVSHLAPIGLTYRG